MDCEIRALFRGAVGTEALARLESRRIRSAGLAQLVERQFCKLDVAGSIPAAGTKPRLLDRRLAKNINCLPACFRSPHQIMSRITLDDCERVFDRALASTSESEFSHVVMPLLDDYELLSMEFGRGSIFWRARVIEGSTYCNVSDLDYPPPSLARRGRLNDPGVPCFYVAAREETALAEVRATEGQLVQVAGYRVKNEAPVRLAIVGEYANVQKSGYMHFAGCDPNLTIARFLNSIPREEALKKIYIDKFFASILADSAASRNDYKFSRALGQLVYSKIHADGIAFPSVRDVGGFNVAVKSEPSDRSFHNVCCMIVRVGRRRRFGIAEYSIIRSAQRIDDEGNFVWLDDAKAGAIGMYGMNKEEFDSASKDPDDRNAMLHMIKNRRDRA